MNQPTEKNPTSFMTATDTGETDKNIPLGVGEMSDDGALDPLAVASEGRRFKAGSFILVLVIAMACGGIWFMKSLSKVGAASTANSDVEATIEKFISKLNGKQAANTGQRGTTNINGTNPDVLAVLSSSYTERQVPLDGVQRNPFIIYGETAIEAGMPVDDNSSGLARRKADRQLAFERAASRLELKSVLMGSQPLANVSGKIVRRGEEIVVQPDNMTFRVSAIDKEFITVIADDADLGLSIPFTVMLKR